MIARAASVIAVAIGAVVNVVFWGGLACIAMLMLLLVGESIATTIAAITGA